MPKANWPKAHGSVCVVANVHINRQAQHISPMRPFSLVSTLGACFFGMKPWARFLSVPKGVIPSFSVARQLGEGTQ